jgi:hypothetical protein
MADTHTIKIGDNQYEVVYRKPNAKPRKGQTLEVRLASHSEDAWFSVAVLKGGQSPECVRQ